MGNCALKTEPVEETNTISINNFNFHYVIGRGGFGKVWKVEQKKTKTVYAMKEMSKARIISKKSLSSVLGEKEVLTGLKHPFLVNMIYAFQDRENLYLLMDLLGGGDLRSHLMKRRTFSEEQTKFFIACIIEALEYVHEKGIIHRDIKPENLVFNSKGYLRTTDFGIAKVWRPDNAIDTSGTPGYMAPEVMCKQNHGIGVDYYAVGIIAFECMLGRRPYYGRDRREIRDQIIAKQVQIRKNDVPEGWSLEAADFINRLIQRKPANRLGVEGPSQVKQHPWFKNFPWEKLANKELESPFIPGDEECDFKQQYALNKFEAEDSESLKQNALLLRRRSVQELFSGYNYDACAIAKVIPCSPKPTKLRSQQSTDSTSLGSQTTQANSALLEIK